MVAGSGAGVLFVGNGVQPVGAAVGRGGDIDGHVDHVGLWGGAMPVLLVRGEVDDATGLDIDGRLAFLRCPAGACDHVEDLTFRVGMPVRTGTRLEEDAVHGYVGGGTGRCGIPPYRAGEPLLGPRPGLHVSRGDDFHVDLLSVGSYQLSAIRHFYAMRCSRILYSCGSSLFSGVVFSTFSRASRPRISRLETWLWNQGSSCTRCQWTSGSSMPANRENASPMRLPRSVQPKRMARRSGRPSGLRRGELADWKTGVSTPSPKSILAR